MKWCLDRALGDMTLIVEHRVEKNMEHNIDIRKELSVTLILIMVNSYSKSNNINASKLSDRTGHEL